VKGEHGDQSAESPSWSFDFSIVGKRHADPLIRRSVDDGPLFPWRFKPTICRGELNLTASLFDTIVDIVSAPRNVSQEKRPRLRSWHAAAAAITISEYVEMEVANNAADTEWKRQEAIGLEEHRKFLVMVKSLHALAVARTQSGTAPLKPLWQLLFAEDESH
jgi:hypothetical protein